MMLIALHCLPNWQCVAAARGATTALAPIEAI